MLIIEIENYTQQLAAILSYFKQEADNQKTSAVIPIDALSQYMDREGMGIKPDVIKDLIANDPIVKNLVKSFDGDKITIDTIVEPKDGDMDNIASTDAVSRMAKKALNRRSK